MNTALCSYATVCGVCKLPTLKAACISTLARPALHQACVAPSHNSSLNKPTRQAGCPLATRALHACQLGESLFSRCCLQALPDLDEAEVENLFHAMDLNHTGTVDVKEVFASLLHTMAPENQVCVRGGAGRDEGRGEERRGTGEVGKGEVRGSGEERCAGKGDVGMRRTLGSLLCICKWPLRLHCLTSTAQHSLPACHSLPHVRNLIPACHLSPPHLHMAITYSTA